MQFGGTLEVSCEGAHPCSLFCLCSFAVLCSAGDGRVLCGTDANQSGGDEPTLSDISILIAALYIYADSTLISSCYAEADVNQSGGLDPHFADITLGDISYLVEYLFAAAECYNPPCYWQLVLRPCLEEDESTQ